MRFFYYGYEGAFVPTSSGNNVCGTALLEERREKEGERRKMSGRFFFLGAPPPSHLLLGMFFIVGTPSQCRESYVDGAFK